MNITVPHELPAEFFDLVDGYCSDLIEEPDLRRLEAHLLASAEARRFFAEYFQHHTEIHFAVRARRAADAVVEQLADRLDKPRGGAWLDEVGTKARGCRRGRRPRIRNGVFAATLIAMSCVCGWLAVVLLRRGPVIPTKVATTNVAWLVNAQDCPWARPDLQPGRNMQAGKSLRLERGLAEIEFDCGARVILQGPAGLELLSGEFGAAPSGHSDGPRAGAGKGVHRPHTTQQGRRPGHRIRTGR